MSISATDPQPSVGTQLLSTDPQTAETTPDDTSATFFGDEFFSTSETPEINATSCSLEGNISTGSWASSTPTDFGEFVTTPPESGDIFNDNPTPLKENVFTHTILPHLDSNDHDDGTLLRKNSTYRQIPSDPHASFPTNASATPSLQNWIKEKKFPTSKIQLSPKQNNESSWFDETRQKSKSPLIFTPLSSEPNIDLLKNPFQPSSNPFSTETLEFSNPFSNIEPSTSTIESPGNIKTIAIHSAILTISEPPFQSSYFQNPSHAELEDLSDVPPTIIGIFTCPICSQIILKRQNMRISQCCDQLFCSNCITTWLGHNVTCPLCRMDLTDNTCPPSRLLLSLLDLVTLKCRNHSTGCPFTGTLTQLSKHQCDFEPIQCQWTGCTTNLPYQDLKSHHLSCPFRSVFCPHSCGSSFSIDKYESHKTTCANLFTDCPENCGSVIKRSQLAHHLSTECLHACTTCPLSWVGCHWTGPRKLLAEHQTECEFSASKKGFLFLLKKIKILSDRISVLETEHCITNSDIDLDPINLTEFEATLPLMGKIPNWVDELPTTKKLTDPRNVPDMDQSLDPELLDGE